MLKVWDSSTGRLVSSLSGEGGAWGPSFGAHDSLVAAAWRGGDVRVLDLSTDRVVSTVRMRRPNDTSLSPDGTLLAIATDFTAEDLKEQDGVVFDLRAREEAFLLTERAQLLQHLEFPGGVLES